MRPRYVALLRGINVGKRKRIAMADLRLLVEDLGFGDVATLLHSGNVVFSGAARSGAKSQPAAKLEAILEASLERVVGVPVRVMVLTAGELEAIVDGNPMAEVAAAAPARFLVQRVADPALLARLEPLLAMDWGPDRLALGPGAAYVACPDGVLQSSLVEAVQRTLGEATTARNWGTMVKLREML